MLLINMLTILCYESKSKFIYSFNGLLSYLFAYVVSYLYINGLIKL